MDRIKLCARALLAGAIMMAGAYGIVVSLPKAAGAAAAAYQRVVASAIEFYSTIGAKRWIANLDTSNNLQLYENSGVKGVVASITTANGGFKVRSRTEAQLNAMTPGGAGEIVFDSTNNTLCISTGATLGAYIPLVPPNSTKISCTTYK